MKRVEGVEDLNSRIICAQGIVGVGATIRTLISSFPAARQKLHSPEKRGFGSTQVQGTGLVLIIGSKDSSAGTRAL